MATNFSQEGCVQEFAAPANVTSGTPVLIGSLVAVPLVTALSGVRCNFALDGVWAAVPKATGATWSEGQVLYWDSTAGNFATAASATARRAGSAAAAAASGDTTGTVRLQNISAAVNVA